MYNTNHTFAICAYKESPFLEACIESLINQTTPTNIILITSTPNPYINNLCQKHNIPIYINEGESGITQDWNFGYSKCNTDFITIAHQDDVYSPDYVTKLLHYTESVKKPLIYFTDYYELRNNEEIQKNKLLTIKRLMLFPLKFKLFWRSKFIRRRILSLGSPICCPSVTFYKPNLHFPVFLHGFRADEDWQAWEIISRLKGSFVYCSLPLTFHRIHEDSETSKILGDNARTIEDLQMFQIFWPKPIAKFLARKYSSSEKSNDI